MSAQPAIPVDSVVMVAPDTTVIYFPVDTAALLERLNFERFDYATLFNTPVSLSKVDQTSTWHLNHRDLVLPLMCLLMLMYVTWLRYTFGKELRENVTVILNTNIGQQIYRDREFSANIFKLLTFINFALGAGVLVFLLAEYFNVAMPFALNSYNIALAVGGVFVLYLCKGLTYRLVGAIFQITPALQFFRFNALVIYHLLGIGLLPFVLLAAFAEPPVDVWALYAALGLIGLALLIRLIKGLAVAGTSGKLHILYFLLYLCALEVAPLLIAIRLFNMWSGVQPK